MKEAVLAGEPLSAAVGWDAVVGQPRAVAALQGAALAPTHAYLLVGRQGYGSRAAARAFAGELLANADPGGDRERHLHLASIERHPAMLVLEKGSDTPTAYLEEIRRQAYLAPSEGHRQVLLVVDIELALQYIAMLLKTIEEPPPSTVFVLLVDDVPDELVTVASRCVRVEIGPVPAAIVRHTLLAEGIGDEVATVVSSMAGGDLDRARLLATDGSVMERHQFWLDLPMRLDDRGSVVSGLVDEIVQQISSVVAPLEARQVGELEHLDAELEQTGVRGAGRRNELIARHKRELRRVRLDEVNAGLATILAVYRERIGEHDADRGFVTAATAIGEYESHLDHNPNERLALLHLLLQLPVAA